jgi:hypothetical protein
MAHTTFEHPKARTCMKLILIALLLLFTACADEAVPGGEETTSPAKTEEQTQTTEGETEQQEDVTENASEAETTQTEPSDIQDAQEQTEPEGTNATTEFTNAEFRAIYWGPGELPPTVWLERLSDTPNEADPTEWPENQLFTIRTEKAESILGSDLQAGAMYTVTTDEKGAVTQMQPVPGMLQESTNDYPEIVQFLSEEIDETKMHLENGLTMLITGETVLIDNEEHLLVLFGSNREGQFVREYHYAIHPETMQLYYLDILQDEWIGMGVG